MIIQFPGPFRDHAFVTSDNAAVDDGRGELLRWMSEKGYAGGEPGHVFAIFEQGRLVREWEMVEKPHTRQ